MAQNAFYARDHNVHNGSGNFNIHNGGNFVQINNSTMDPFPHLRKLYDAVAGVEASHTSKQQFARGKCLEGTRREPLGEIHEWRLSGDPSVPICWLCGTAGVGKSAIAMTVAKSCEEDGLVASFFFFRSDPRRNNPNALALSIALGLVSKIPSLRAFINQRIFQNPTILEANLEDQFRELVWKPSLEAKRLESERRSLQKVPNLVIIDGLDECGDEDTQKHILATILSSYQQLAPWTYPPLKFLICSRPEAWIRETFDEDIGQSTKCITLDYASQTDQDIERYFLHEFQNIRKNPKFARLPFPSPWPSNLELSHLVQKSSRQFVYAATAVKFVRLPYSNPLDQLHVLLSYTIRNQSSNSRSPFPELDRLYHIILSDNPNREKLLSVLAAIFIAGDYLPPSPELVEVLLDLTPGDVDLTLRAMHSVLDMQGGRNKIRAFHNSFRDYLFDRTRSGIFFIDRRTQAQFLAPQWLQALTPAKLRRYSFHQLFQSEHEPLFTKWIPFCLELCQPSQELLTCLQNVELSAVSLCHGGSWTQVFGGLVSWLQKSNVHDVDPDIIARFQNRPKHFHLESSRLSEEDPIKFDILERAAIFGVSDYRNWEYLFFRDFLKNPPHPFTFRITDCHCNSAPDLASSSYAHKHYEAACLRTVKILLSEPTHWAAGWHHIPFENLIGSSLLQHCAFGPELFTQCRILFSLGRGMNTHYRWWSEMNQRHQTKLLDWLETCPEQYASEAEDLKSQVMSLFSREPE
ncbi:hypothetical protein PM082_019076 [Marasmius tenuissimus]|nr:hypothetical protein PM082_019076 [Marasmius tenuissimus]